MDLRISTEYDPMGMVYTITAGKHSVILPERAVTREGITDLTEALVGISDDNTIKTILNGWAVAAESKANGSLTDGKIKTVLDSIDASRSKVNAAIANWANSIIYDPGKDTIVACMDIPEPKPYYDPNDIPKVYYQPRYPSKPPMVIIEEALELLNSKKHLGIGNIELSKVDKSTIRLTLSSATAAKIPGYKRILSVWIEYKAFDRAYSMETDRNAGLTARLDTDTYIKLRLAFLINQALKRAETLALATVLDVFKVIGSFDR